MLHDFLRANREEIVARARAKAAPRPGPHATGPELENGIPMFLTQLGEILETIPPLQPGHDRIGKSASRHGDDMWRMGFTVGQLVQDYGGLCQAITELAVERKASIDCGEFKTLNGCLDVAVAAAVTEFGRQQEQTISDQQVKTLGVLAHELRNALSIAILAFDALHSGAVGMSDSASGVVVRSMARMEAILDRSFVEVRSQAGSRRPTRLSVAALIEQVAVAAGVEAAHRGLHLTVESVADDVAIHADAEIVVSALSNLLRNALKFTHAAGHVSLRTRATADRVRIEVEDECGGLPSGDVESLFDMFAQGGDDRSGLGLGLAIVRQGAEESGGAILVRDLPGKGCVFTIDLPRSGLTEAVPPPALRC